MYKNLLFALLIFGTCILKAQQDGYQTHFQFNEISFNPSYSGKNDGKICISSLLHQQYLGFKSDAITNYENKVIIAPYRIAPQTQYFNLSVRVVHRVGISFSFIRDEIGPQQMKLPKLNLSYYFNYLTGHVALGLYLGEMQKSLDGNLLVPLSMLQPPYIPDPNVPLTRVTGTKLDAGFGIHYLNATFNNFNLGISATHLVNDNFTFQNNKNQTLNFSSIKTHYYLNSSMDFPLNASQIIIQPNLLFKYGSRFQADANLIAIFNNMYYGGFSFRQDDNINMMIGYMIGDLKIGYAFDLIVNNLKPGTKTSHELFIQYCYSLNSVSRYILNPRFMQAYPN